MARSQQDMVCIEYKDKAYLEDECRDGADLGFDGKQVIHPAQLDAVNRAFSPSEEGTLHALTKTLDVHRPSGTPTSAASRTTRALWA